MPTPGEHKTVQARILAYAQEIGWTYVPRGEAERRRGFDPDGVTPEARARNASLFFGDLLHDRVRAFNADYREAEGALLGEFRRLSADIAGNRDFLIYLRNQGKFFCAEQNRELDLTLIDYGDLARPREAWQNVYEVTEEFYVHNSRHETREDVVFLINGIPVLVIECKNASKDEAIARVNRPYEIEAEELVKPHGFVLDFVGIFDKLEKALAFDSDEINAIVKDIGLLKQLFKAKMETKAPAYLAFVTQNFNDKDVDNLIDHFRDPERRKELFREYKEIEMLYEIISPDAFLRPFLEDYATLSGIYEVVRNAYARRVYVDRAFQKKTNELVQRHIGTAWQEERGEYVTLDRSTIEIIKKNQEGKATKVINLIKSIEKTAEENSDDPFLIAMAERARAVQERFEERQTDTEEALADLLAAIEKNEQRKREQAAKSLDALTYFVLLKLTDECIPNPEAVSRKVREAFARFPNWKGSDAELRELRKAVTFAIYAEEDNLEKVAATVESLFTLLLGKGRG